MRDEKIEEIIKDRRFLDNISKMETPEEVQSAFKNKGVDLSLDEVGALGDIINSISDKKFNDFCEEELNEITGGAGVKELINKANGLANRLKTASKEMRGKSWSDYTPTEKKLAVVSSALLTAEVGALALGAGVIGIVGYKTVKWAKNKYLTKK